MSIRTSKSEVRTLRGGERLSSGKRASSLRVPQRADFAIFRLQGERCLAIWEEIQGGLQESIEASESEVTPQDLLWQICEGHADLWVALDVDSKVRSFMITQPITSASGNWLDMVLTNSSGVFPAINTLFQAVENWAKNNGFVGTKMITVSEKVERVMTGRMGMSVRFKELVKRFEE